MDQPKAKAKQEVKKRKRLLLKGDGKYDKIFYRQKVFLLKGVFVDKAQIKETAQNLNVNYSTAKTFLRKFNNVSLNTDFICDVCNWFIQISKSKVRCSYRNIGGRNSEASAQNLLKETAREQNDNLPISYLCFQKSCNNEERPAQIKIVQQVLFK